MIKKKPIGMKLIFIYVLFMPHDGDYITDWGNGVIIKGDRYVKSGKWAYDCKRWRLVSIIPKPFPIEHFKSIAPIEPDYYLSAFDRKTTAKEFINQMLSTDYWHKNLRYVDTYITDSSEIYSHSFEVSSLYKGEQWTLRIAQRENPSIKKAYSITADIYDATYHKPHEELLEEAKASCPKPQ
jgi:hypothetical protein